MLAKIVMVVLCVALASGCRADRSPRAAAEGRRVDAGAAGGHIAGIPGALKTVPAGVVPRDGSGWTDAKVDVTNRALATEAVGRPITLRLKVREVIRWEKGYALNGPTEEINGLADVDFWIYFHEPNALTAARLNLGDEVTVTGKLAAMRFDRPQDRPNGAHLYVEVDEAALQTRVAAGR